MTSIIPRVTSQVYLFLKDLVHSRADLAAQRFAIHRYIVDRVGEDVSVLLDEL